MEEERDEDDPEDALPLLQSASVTGAPRQAHVDAASISDAAALAETCPTSSPSTSRSWSRVPSVLAHSA